MSVPLFVQKNETGSSSVQPEKTDVPKPRLLDQVRDTIRRKHYSIRTEQSYIDWIKRFIYFHDKQHPRDLNESHITEFLNFLAVQKKVASSTQNQALCALVFLYKEVVKKSWLNLRTWCMPSAQAGCRWYLRPMRSGPSFFSWTA